MAQNDTSPSPIPQLHQSLPRNLREVMPAAWGGRILPSLRRYRAGSRRTGRGAGSEWCGCRSTSGRYLPGAMDEQPCVQGPEIALRVLPPNGLWRPRARQRPSMSRHDLRAPQSSGWSKAVSGHKPRSRGEAWVSLHAVYRLRDRSLAMPLTSAALLFDIAGRAGGRVRSPCVWLFWGN